MNIYLDLETIGPNWDDLRKAKWARAKVPKTHKKPESIDKWVHEHWGETYRRTALDWRHLHIWVIGYKIDDDEPVAICEGNEADTMAAFAQVMATHCVGGPRWVGHNIKGFDMPLLWRRACRYGLSRLRFFLPHDKWSKSIIDTAEVWAATDWKSYHKLSDICAYLGIPVKTGGIDGSKVYDAYLAGETDRVIDYCLEDVQATYECAQMMGALGV